MLETGGKPSSCEDADPVRPGAHAAGRFPAAASPAYASGARLSCSTQARPTGASPVPSGENVVTRRQDGDSDARYAEGLYWETTGAAVCSTLSECGSGFRLLLSSVLTAADQDRVGAMATGSTETDKRTPQRSHGNTAARLSVFRWQVGAGP
ncbi:hypothetical protein JEQ12_018555 [Ovis aries]|uniref:Uncharacterized protein n=1 Tax=Ovis aries TaxID=9940 RepID=A0A836A1H7_SHEEP|nr:hypothetical protein JEQ12_018555 [Ovis aries]